MTCSKCGTNNVAEAMFCAGCGTQLTQQAPIQPTTGYPETTNPQYPENPYVQGGYTNAPNPPDMGGYPNTSGPYGSGGYPYGQTNANPGKSGIDLKKILLIAIPAIVLIVAAIIFIPMLIDNRGGSSGGGSSAGGGDDGGSGGRASRDSGDRANHILIFEDGDEVFISGNNNEKFSIDGNLYDYHTSADGSKAVVLADYSYNQYSSGTLWFVTTTDATKIADDVVSCFFSDSGDGVAYFSDYVAQDQTASLYLYDTTSRNGTLIAQDVYYWSPVVISPDGRSVGYVTDYNSSNNEFTGYIKVDGNEPERLGGETFAVAISNSGRHLYYIRTDRYGGSSLHVRSRGNDLRLAVDQYYFVLRLNQDYSEVLYASDGRSYISKDGGERERISGPEIGSILVSQEAQTRDNNVYFANTDVIAMVYDVRSMSGFVARTESGLAYYNSELERNAISGAGQYGLDAQISNDGRTLFYLDVNNTLFSIDPTNPNAERVEIGEYVDTFVSSVDGRSVYYVNYYGELFFSGGGGTPAKISDDVYAESLTVFQSANRAFFLIDFRGSSRGGELYYSNSGGTSTRVPGADEVIGVMATPTCVWYGTRYEELYRSNGSDRFDLFHDMSGGSGGSDSGGYPAQTSAPASPGGGGGVEPSGSVHSIPGNGGEVYIDYYMEVAFTPTTSGTWYINTWGNGSSDPYLTIYDQNWNYITADDDSGGSYNASLDVYLEAGVRYIISVDFLGSETGCWLSVYR